MNSKGKENVELALGREHLLRMQAHKDINAQNAAKQNAFLADANRRGMLLSGPTFRKLLMLASERAKSIIAKDIELRRETIRHAPELASDEAIESLIDELSRFSKSAMQLGLQEVRKGLKEDASMFGAVSSEAERQTSHLNDFARSQCLIMQKDFQLAEMQASKLNRATADPRKVWVVHGRNLKARDAMFEFLRALDLAPMEWSEALSLTGTASPYIGETLDRAFSHAKAAVVLITGDELARLGTRYIEPTDTPMEMELSPQARPNVLFEAGMAFGRLPEATVLVQIGQVRPFSDIAGRQVLFLTNDVRKRQFLADRLRDAGCAVQTQNRTDWHSAGDFDAACRTPDSNISESQYDADTQAFIQIKDELIASKANAFYPDIGSEQDRLAERLVQRGYLSPGPMGGYILRRYR